MRAARALRRRGEHAVRGAALRAAALRVQVGPWLAARRALSRYRLLDEDELRATRRSDTVFVFGSSASLNEIPAADWDAIAAHDTMGFNWFVRQRFVRCDYHLIRGIPDNDTDASIWRPQLDDYFRTLRANELFRDTIYLVQTGLRATNGNRALGYGYLRSGSRIFLWRTNTRRRRPARSFAEGLTHGTTTLQECVNLAWLLGWREIVLVGVDLRDRRYFWAPEETRTVDLRRGATASDPHAQAVSGFVEDIAGWAHVLGETGTTLLVYDRRSLLAGALGVYDGAAKRASIESS